jgi:alpha-glucuronidase
MVSAWFVFAPELHAETGYEAWLRHAKIDDPVVRRRYESLPAVVVALGDSLIVQAAQEELVRGVHGMLGRTLRVETQLPRESAILLGTLDRIEKAAPVISQIGLKPRR